MDENELQKLAEEAQKFYREGKWSASIEKWDEVIPHLSGGAFRAMAYRLRGNAKQHMGDHVAAIADYDRTLEIDPQDAAAYNSRGNTKASMGEYEAAIADFDQALKIDPQYAVAYNNRGNAKVSIDEHEAAITDFDWALGIDPPYAAAYNNRGIAKSKMGEHTAAIADFDQALGIDPQYAAAYNNRGNTKASMGEYEAAIADFDQALGIDPQDDEAYSNRGAAKIDMGEHAAAIADFDQALKINPGNKEAIHNRAVALALQESDKDRNAIKEEYQAQLQEQKERFDRELQAKIRGAASAHDDIVKALDYEKNLRDYGDKFGEAEERIRFWMRILAATAAVVFGGIAVMVYLDDSNPFTSLPFVAMGSLVLSPLVWYLRMLNRDKQRYLVLREDARANLTLARIIRTNPDIHNELSVKLFDHHDKRGSANLIADWNRADIGGDTPVSVGNIINRDDKSGDK